MRLQPRLRRGWQVFSFCYLILNFYLLTACLAHYRLHLAATAAYFPGTLVLAAISGRRRLAIAESTKVAERTISISSLAFQHTMALSSPRFLEKHFDLVCNCSRRQSLIETSECLFGQIIRQNVSSRHDKVSNILGVEFRMRLNSQRPIAV